MAYNSKTQTFDTSPELRERVGKDGSSVFVLGYYVAGDIGQTLVYTYSASSDADDDGGIVFKPDSIDSGDPGRWLLSYTQPVNVLWFGLKAGNTGFDNLTLFNNMIAALPNIPATPTLGYNLKGAIHFPRNENNYYFSDTITLIDAITITGEDGADALYGTNLQFPVDKTGIHIRPNVDGVSRGAYVFIGANFKLKSDIGTDTTKPGMVISRPAHLTNVNVTGFTGGGISVDTSVEGIADLCFFQNCATYYNGESGFITKGIDSNQCTIINHNSFGNYRWGFDEQSFLGNTYINPHTNSNSIAIGNPVWAFHDTHTYACIQNHTNIEPNVTSGWQDYWVIVPLGIVAPSDYFPAWSNSKAYKTGGAFNSREAVNNWTTWVGPYSEGGQPPSAVGYRNTIIGGDNGAGYRDKFNPFLGAYDGQLYSSSGMKVVVPVDFSTPATQETSMDELGFSVFPSVNGVRGGGISLLWSTQLNSFALTYASDFSKSAYWITTAASDASFYGRSVAPDSIMDFIRGIFLGCVDNYPQARMLGMADDVPVAGTFGIGDILLKRITGAGDSIIGWRCTVAGTPGTWEEMVSGATVNVVDGTPTNTVTPTGWFKTSIEGVDAWLPYYQ